MRHRGARTERVWKLALAGALFTGCQQNDREVGAERDAAVDAGSASSVDADVRVSAPQVVGVLAGPGARYEPSALQLYGTDLGFSFEHAGRLRVLFGDTTPYERYYCDVQAPDNDDMQGELPLHPDDELPVLSVTTRADAPDAIASLRLFRGDDELTLGLGQTPLTGFSDGRDAYALFGRIAHTTCGDASGDEPACGSAGDDFECAQEVGLCTPEIPGYPYPCTLGDDSPCNTWQTCSASDSGYCVDRGASPFSGDDADLPLVITRDTEIARERSDEPGVYDSVLRFVSKRFHSPAAYTVARFDGASDDADYRGGHGALLLWGRPGFGVRPDRQAHLYFAYHPLPLSFGDDGQLVFTPRYFAGYDRDGEPTWSEQQRDAAPLSLDGDPFGSPDEPRAGLNQMSVRFIGPPIDRFVLLYAGGRPGVSALGSPELGQHDRAAYPHAVLARFAEHPYGPFSPPQPLAAPDDPARDGALNGPGGILYDPECVDGVLPCAPSDPIRPADSVLPGCPLIFAERDQGHLYGANLIEHYTRPADDDSVWIYFNVSTWNPYAVVLMKATLTR